MLWPIFVLMTMGAIAAVFLPLLRQRGPVQSGDELAIYRDQLGEIDRDKATGLIAATDAEAARVEVSRRLLGAAESAKAASSAAPVASRLYRRATLVAVIVLLPLGAGAMYLAVGSPNFAPVSVTSAEDLPDGIEQTVAEVEAHLEKNPGDGRGWELLAPVYLRLGRLDDAVKARRKGLEIFGPDAARLGDLGEAIYMASAGVVTPEAKELFLRAEAADREDVMAQYYLGVSAKQEGRRGEAEKRWRALIASAPENVEYLPLIKRALAQIDQKDLRAGAEAPPEHDGKSVEAMVERLANRLKKDGSDVAGWIQLVRSYRVLGKADMATAAVAEAHAALASSPEGLQHLEEGLQALGAASGRGPDPSVAATDSARPTAAVTPPQPRLSASDIAAAGEMTPAERDGMIQSMVARLAERMAQNGSDVEGWLRLIRAYSVLGERDKALAVAANARTALAGNNDSLRRIGELTKELGLEGS